MIFIIFVYFLVLTVHHMHALKGPSLKNVNVYQVFPHLTLTLHPSMLFLCLRVHEEYVFYILGPFSLDLYWIQHCRLFTVSVVRCRGAPCTVCFQASSLCLGICYGELRDCPASNMSFIYPLTSPFKV